MRIINAIQQSTTRLVIAGVTMGIFIELLSLSMNYNATAQSVVTLVIAAVTFLLCIKNLQYGIAIQCIELLTGSKGYLFALSIGGTTLSIRMVLFATVFLATLYWMVRQRSVAILEWKRFSLWLVVLCVVAASVLMGYANGHALGTLFQDANAYLFLLWVIPLAQAVHKKNSARIVVVGVWIGVVLLFVKTLSVLFVFSHPGIAGSNLIHLYKWIRDTGVGEITPFGTGFQRVFFQSHVYAVFLFVGSIVYTMHRALVASGSTRAIIRSLVPYVVLSSVSFAVILLSYSRSFWVATACGIGMLWLYSVVLSVRQYRATKSVEPALYTTVLLAVTTCIGTILVIATVFFPLPGKYAHNSTGPLFSDRVSSFTSDSAASSRWQQLPPLRAAAFESPVAGKGLGATVTYISNDPRVRAQSPDGTYTTFAFEWGYLDMMLKFGIVGLALMAVFLVALGTDVWRLATTTQLALPVFFSGVVLCIVHVFTPYLNHPLGIAPLCLAAAMTLFVEQKKHRL